MERRNEGPKRKSPKQDLTSAKDLTIEVVETCVLWEEEGCGCGGERVLGEGGVRL